VPRHRRRALPRLRDRHSGPLADGRAMTGGAPLIDTLGRALRTLRLSVTDRCNLRCHYCMPEPEYAWLPRDLLLRFEEATRLVRVLTGLGVRAVRLTGGEPLLRHGLPDLVASLAAQPLADLALTTNGLLLERLAEPLKRAGLKRLTVSLDTLAADRFRALTGQGGLSRVVGGIRAAARCFGGVKIDAVILRGVNDDELADLLEFGAEVGAEVRFIEYMDVAGATRWTADAVVPSSEMIARVRARYGSAEPIEEPDSAAPATRFALPDGRTFGIVASTTSPFCRACDRVRLTADGTLYMCLYGTEGLALRDPMRSGATDEALAGLVAARWRARADRGAEERASLPVRRAYLPLRTLRADPRLEMHSRGG